MGGPAVTPPARDEPPPPRTIGGRRSLPREAHSHHLGSDECAAGDLPQCGDGLGMKCNAARHFAGRADERPAVGVHSHSSSDAPWATKPPQTTVRLKECDPSAAQHTQPTDSFARQGIACSPKGNLSSAIISTLSADGLHSMPPHAFSLERHLLGYYLLDRDTIHCLHFDSADAESLNSQ
jgi:hypothetical protein